MLTATFLVNRVASLSLQKQSPLQILQTVFPPVKLGKDLPKQCLIVSVMYTYIQIRSSNYHLGPLSVYS